MHPHLGEVCPQGLVIGELMGTGATLGLAVQLDFRMLVIFGEAGGVRTEDELRTLLVNEDARAIADWLAAEGQALMRLMRATAAKPRLADLAKYPDSQLR